MDTADELLQFGLRLAYYTEWSQMTETRWRQLRADLIEFFDHRTDPWHDRRVLMVYDETAGPHPRDFTKTDFHALQTDTRRLFDSVLANEQPDLRNCACHFTVRPLARSGWPFLTFSGSTAAMFLLRLAFLLVTPAAAEQLRLTQQGGTIRLHSAVKMVRPPKLRRCPAPSARTPQEPCNKIFVRIRKQRYCSKGCTDRVAQQAKRARAQKRKRDKKKA